MRRWANQSRLGCPGSGQPNTRKPIIVEKSRRRNERGDGNGDLLRQNVASTRS